MQTHKSFAFSLCAGGTIPTPHAFLIWVNLPILQGILCNITHFILCVLRAFTALLVADSLPAGHAAIEGSPMKEPPKSLDTLGGLIDHDWGVMVYCRSEDRRHGRCSHSAWLDLPALAKRLGRDHGCLAADLLPKLRCRKCGKKAASLRLHPPNAWNRR